MKPFVSVVVPMFNAERYIIEALESVRAQAYEPLDVIVVDDGSTDSSASLVRSYAAQCGMTIHYLYQENAGPAAARNLGLEACRGEIVAFQDADDLWSGGRLALQIELIEREPSADIVLGRVQFFRIEPDEDAMTYIGAERRFPLLQSGIYRRDFWDRVGPLNRELRYHEDIEWFHRAHNAGALLRLHDEVALYHRRHEGNMTNRRTQLAQAWLPLLRQLRGQPATADPLWKWMTEVV